MRIVAGAWRGRALIAPPGEATRPTADRVRQALFDMLAHAPWMAPTTLQDAVVLDLFAGTGALGLEALSRGAARVVFVEQARPALAALRANISACRAEDRCKVLALDALKLPARERVDILVLDPPYGKGLVPRAMEQARAKGWAGPGSLVVAETGRDEPALEVEPLAERTHGAARITIWREA